MDVTIDEQKSWDQETPFKLVTYKVRWLTGLIAIERSFQGIVTDVEDEKELLERIKGEVFWTPALLPQARFEIGPRFSEIYDGKKHNVLFDCRENKDFIWRKALEKFQKNQ